MKYEIKISWQAFGRPTSLEFEWESTYTEKDIVNQVFRDTNLYEGLIWDKIETLLPENRTHTALSVGDLVTVNGTVYLCKPEGWDMFPEGETP